MTLSAARLRPGDLIEQEKGIHPGERYRVVKVTPTSVQMEGVGSGRSGRRTTGAKHSRRVFSMNRDKVERTFRRA